MGLFDIFKNKAQEITKKAQELIEDDDVREEVIHEQEEVIHEQEYDDDDDNEEEYQYSDKEIQGVAYPHGWEDLSEADMLTKMDEIMEEYTAADGDEEKEDAIFPKYGFNGPSHYENFKNALIMERSEKEGVSFTQAAINQSTEKNEATIQANINSDREDLKPVDGVSLEDWAKASASIANTGGMDEALKITGKDKAGWDKINEEWMARMSNDLTFTISQIYGNAFTANATGNLGGVDDITVDSFPYEKYVEIEVAQNLLTQQGKDAQEVFEMFGMTAIDWSNVSTFWSKEYHADVDKYYPLHTEYTEKYEAKYKAGDSNADIEF